MRIFSRFAQQISKNPNRGSAGPQVLCFYTGALPPRMEQPFVLSSTLNFHCPGHQVDPRASLTEGGHGI